MLAIGNIATWIACIAVAALAIGTLLDPSQMHGRGTDLMTRPVVFQQVCMPLLFFQHSTVLFILSAGINDIAK